MISVFICDDEEAWVRRIADAVTEYQDICELPVNIVCRALSPAEVLDCFQKAPVSGGIYFLDIDLKTSPDGLELAQKIRLLDPGARLI